LRFVFVGTIEEDIQMAAEVPVETLAEVVEKTEKVLEKKDTWVGTLFKWMSYIFVFWIVVLAL
jgi:hypothetical protein